ncbi:MAG TPA: molecular chaperone DnaJ [Thermopetrobacter sp.]|nr:molecular chaperone DnaJ [Thermopetrobacter sp.]
MAQILSAIVVVLGLAGALYWLIHAPPRQVAGVMKKSGGLALIGLGLTLSARGGLAIGLPLMLAGGVMLLKDGNPFGGGGAAKRGRASEVNTRLLRMRLDHDSGEMEGEVLTGRFAGRALSGLKRAELRLLHEECAAAGDQSLHLLEAWLERTHPGWREWIGRAARGDGPMTVARAREILGVDETATAADIRAAHRRLMKTAHPDHGGSDWLARQINEARDVLLAALGE